MYGYSKLHWHNNKWCRKRPSLWTGELKRRSWKRFANHRYANDFTDAAKDDIADKDWRREIRMADSIFNLKYWIPYSYSLWPSHRTTTKEMIEWRSIAYKLLNKERPRQWLNDWLWG